MLGNSFVINPHLRKLNYDPLTSFEPICYLVRSPTLLVVNAASPYRTFADLVAAARANPGGLTLAKFMAQYRNATPNPPPNAADNPS